ncbi:MAG TPA: sensor domain-containing diguanylate cyclase [Woeseiaceae bacterium]
MTGPEDDTALTRTVASTATMKLASLHSIDPFYTPLEERFERITRLARRALKVPIAAITVVQGDRQWFKSISGLSLTEMPVDKSLCAPVLKENRPIIVSDTQLELDLMSKPLVCGNPGIRFYAGAPIRNADGNTIGTFCAMDIRPRTPDDDFRTILLDLADMAQRELFSVELRNAQSALVSKLGKARRQAMFDPLTRLWNRRGGLELLNSALKEATHYNHTLGICLADIDNFKQINDQFGHQVGDQVLRRAAGGIVASVRPQDIVCRYGGEEFLVIVHDVNETGLVAVGERICAGMRKLAMSLSGEPLPATISVGVALRARDQSIGVDELIARADRALYASKRAGRDRVTVGRE